MAMDSPSCPTLSIVLQLKHLGWIPRSGLLRHTVDDLFAAQRYYDDRKMSSKKPYYQCLLRLERITGLSEFMYMRSERIVAYYKALLHDKVPPENFTAKQIMALMDGMPVVPAQAEDVHLVPAVGDLPDFMRSDSEEMLGGPTLALACPPLHAPAPAAVDPDLDFDGIDGGGHPLPSSDDSASDGAASASSILGEIGPEVVRPGARYPSDIEWWLPAL